MPDTKPDFQAICRDSTPEIGALTNEARALIKSLDDKVVEVIWERQKIAGYGVGPKKMSEHYVYLSPFKNHLNLGYYRGALLNAPEGLLEGSGKELRHIKLRTSQDLNRPEVTALIAQARQERITALGLG